MLLHLGPRCVVAGSNYRTLTFSFHSLSLDQKSRKHSHKKTSSHPPPSREGAGDHHPKNNHTPSAAATNATSANSSTFLVLSSDSDLTEAESTEDDEEAGRKGSGPIVIEDVCLVCHGTCRCGGATGENVHVAPRGIKLKLNVGAASAPIPAFDAASLPPLPPSAPIASTSAHPHSFEPEPRARRGSSSAEDEYAPPPSKKQRTSTATGSRKGKATAPSAAAAVAPPTRKRGKPDTASPLVSASASPAPPSLPNGIVAPSGVRKSTTSTSSKPSHNKRDPSLPSAAPAPTTTTSLSRAVNPSRMSLRQVLAMSIREASQSANNSEADEPSGEKEEKEPERMSDVSDLDLLDSDDEEAEERALRAEFERSKRGSIVSDSEGLTELEEEDGEGWEANVKGMQRLRGETNGKWNQQDEKTTVEDDMSFEDDPDLAITDLPPTGGLGVVTWSDYDSVDMDEDDEDAEDGEKAAHNIAQNFENELEELLAISEAVVGPVRDDELELGELWFEEMSDDESGSAADDESEGGGTSDDEEDEEDDGQGMKLVADGGWGFQTRSLSGSSAGDDSASEMYFSDGDTTDSIDSDDMNRFGLEAPEDEDTDSACSETDYYRDAPGTASLADVQAPTTADLASLPQYLFTEIDLAALDSAADPEKALRDAAAELEVAIQQRKAAKNHSSPVRPPFVAHNSKGKGKMRDIAEEDEAGTGTDGETTAAGGRTPAMGTFSKKASGRTQEFNVVVIDGSDTFAPSPFSMVKKSKKRAGPLVSFFCRLSRYSN